MAKKTSSTEFECGDVVMLKSSGPKMTVARNDEDGLVVCDFFDCNGCFIEGTKFAARMLVEVEG